MSQRENPIPSQLVLQELVDEARDATGGEAFGEHVRWDRVEETLFARVEREAAERRALDAHRGRAGAWLLLGGMAAAAAAFAVTLQPSSRSSALLSGATASSSAGDLTLQKGAGEIVVSGEKARTGAHARAGDTIGTHGAKAVFEAPRRVSWLLEDESSVTVERAGVVGTPIVLALRQGAVEADVTPVPAGEAFAIDVEGIRVAVHGTHLRVARDGDRVVVDLTEGVVSIGAPPKSGSTYGTLVTAPAHVEFSASALDATLLIDHVGTGVRHAVDLSSVLDEGETASVTPLTDPSPKPAGRALPAPRRSSLVAAQPKSSSVVPRELNTFDDIESAVAACAAQQPHSSEVAVTVTSTVKVTLGEDGTPKLFLFDPPLATPIEACAQPVIFSMRFAETGVHMVPIRF